MTGPIADSYDSWPVSPTFAEQNGPESDSEPYISSVTHLPAFFAQARSLAEAESAITILKRAGEELKLIVEHHKTRLEVVQDQADQRKNQVAALSAELAHLRGENFKLAESFAEKDAAIAALRIQVDAANHTIAITRSTVEQELDGVFSNKISVLESRLRDEKKKNNDVETRLHQASLALTTAEKRRTEEGNQLTKELEYTHKDAEMHAENFSTQIADLKRQVSETGRLKHQVIQAQLSLKTHVQELESLKKQHGEIFEQKLARDQEFEFLARRVKQLERKKDLADREFAIAIEKNAKLENATNQANTELVEKQQMQQKLEFLENVKYKLDQAEAELKSNAKLISDLQDQVFEQETLRRELANLQSRHRDFAATVKAREGEVANLIEADKSKSTQVAETQQKLDQVQEERRADKRRWREKTEGVQKTLTELGERLSKSQCERRELEQLAAANKRKFEEKLLEYERRVLLAEMYRPSKVPASKGEILN
jgi:chromosome segregation ATPase